MDAGVIGLIALAVGMPTFLILVALLGKSGKSADNALVLRAAATKLGLDYVPHGKSSGIDVLTDRNRGLSLSICVGADATEFQIDGGGRWPWELCAGTPHALSSIAGSSSAPYVRIGDPGFDANVRIRGDEEYLAARFDEKTRRVLRNFTDVGGTIAWGKVSLQWHATHLAKDDVTGVAEAMMALAARLTAHGSTPRLLADNATGDHDPAMRAHCLQLLHDKFADSDAAPRALEAALADRDESVRLLAATLDRGPKGLQVLRALVADARAEMKARVDALGRCVSIFGYAEARESIESALTSASELKIAAVAAAGDAADAAQLDRVCALAPSSDEALGKAVAAALGKIGDARAEGALIGLLAHAEIPVRVAAAKALWRCGTVRAVEPLLALTGGLLHAELQEAARDSVRMIQARLVDADAGRLSVAPLDETAGAVSVASEGGEVSLAPDRAPDRTKS
jgi:hypothetical protein